MTQSYSIHDETPPSAGSAVWAVRRGSEKVAEASSKSAAWAIVRKLLADA